MARTIQFEGRRFSVPDDATDAEIEAIVTAPRGILDVAKGSAKVAAGAEQAAPVPSALDSFNSGVRDTFTFGGGDEIAAGARTGFGLWGDYAGDLEQTRKAMEKERDANPGWYVGGQFAGAVPSMAVPGLGASRGVSLLGTAGRMGASGLAAGSTYGFASGDSLSDRGTGAAYGAVAGGLTGAAAPVAGRAVTAALPFLPGMANSSMNAFGRAAAADNIPTGVAMRNALAGYGPNAVPADLGPNLQRQAGALASLPGPAQQTIRDALVARNSGANGRIIGEIDQTLGAAPVPSHVNEGITTSQRALDPEYRAALDNATAVDTSDIALLLDSQIVNLRGKAQQELVRVRDMLNVVGTNELDPNPATLLEIRKAIDGQLAGETNTNVVRVLSDARRRVDEVLADAAPGIKDVDAKFAELARQREAFQRGQQVLDSGRTAPRPAELAAEVADAALPQGRAVGPSAVPVRLREGARAEIDRIIGTNSNDVVALNKMIKGDGSWNRDRLATLFGPEAADRIIALVDRERRFAGTASVVMQNSETAARTAAQKEVAPGADNAGFIQSLLNLKPGDAAARAAGWVVGGRNDAARSAANNELARMLVSAPVRAGHPDPLVIALEAAARQRRAAQALESGANAALVPVARGGTIAFTNAAQGR